MVEDKKLLPIYILDILKTYTDEKHSLKYSDIAEKLKEKLDIEVSTKTIARNVSALIEYGYDIIKKGNYGCALLSRYVDNSEMAYLVDGLFSSKVVTSQQAQNLMMNLTRDFSIYERKRYDYIYKADEIVRANNKSFFYNIDTISRAIEENKQISFTYNEILADKKLKTRHNGKKFIINPYFLINNHGKYYLVCNYDKYNSLSNYKVECISNIKILNTPIKPLDKLEDTKDFNITKYVNEHIYMFSGQTITATIKVANEKVINDIIDWYGEGVDIEIKDKEIFVSFNVNEQAFLYWALQYGLNIEIIEPAATREKYIEMLDKIANKYKTKGE